MAITFLGWVLVPLWKSALCANDLPSLVKKVCAQNCLFLFSKIIFEPYLGLKHWHVTLNPCWNQVDSTILCCDHVDAMLCAQTIHSIDYHSLFFY